MLANIFGDWYWVVLAIIVLFGGSQLPKLARNSGEALKEFRKAHADEPQASPAVGPGTGQSAARRGTGRRRPRLPSVRGAPDGGAGRTDGPSHRR